MQHTDGAKHSLEWFNEYKDYGVITVTAATFNQQKQKGLFKYDYAEIDSDSDFIYFRYYSDAGQLLALETVPIIKDGEKGDTGAEGERGGQYWGTTQPTAPVKGDSYLDVVTMYLKDYNGISWDAVPYTDADRYNAAISDIIAHADNAGGALELANAWVSKLVAGTILANSIFSKTLKVSQSLRAGNLYTENGEIDPAHTDEAGAYMGADGVLKAQNAIFNNIEVENGVFKKISIIPNYYTETDVFNFSESGSDAIQFIRFFKAHGAANATMFCNGTFKFYFTRETEHYNRDFGYKITCSFIQLPNLNLPEEDLLAENFRFFGKVVYFYYDDYDYIENPLDTQYYEISPIELTGGHDSFDVTKSKFNFSI